MISRHNSSVVALGLAQTLAWASSYYLLAILAAPMSRDLGCTVPTVFAALSVALLVAAGLGPFAGRAIDRWGGRSVLMGTNIVFAAGLAILGSVHGVVGLFAPGSSSASPWEADSTRRRSRRWCGSTDGTRATRSRV